MDAKFSPSIKAVIQNAREEAIRLGNNSISCEHLVLAIVCEGKGRAFQTLQSLNIDCLTLKKSIEDYVQSTTNSISKIEKPALAKQAYKALKITYLEAEIFDTDIIDTEHLLLSILKDSNNGACKVLAQYGVTYNVWKYSTGARGSKYLGYPFLLSLKTLKILVQKLSKRK